MQKRADIGCGNADVLSSAIYTQCLHDLPMNFICLVDQYVTGHEVESYHDNSSDESSHMHVLSQVAPLQFGSVMYLSSVHRGTTLVLASLHKVLMESSYTILPNAPLCPTTYFTRSHGTNMYVLPFACTKVHSLTLRSHYWNNLPSLVATYPQTPLGWAGL